MHPSSALHGPGWGHPEHQGRLRALVSAVRAATPELHDRVESLAGTAAEPADLLRVHSPELVARIQEATAEAARTEAGVAVDETGETLVSSASWAAAVGSVGACLDASRAVATGQLQSAFVAARPPGHHATGDDAMGFCLFNSVAIAAATLRAEGLADRILIVDWDVHHGNGTQDIFFEEAHVFYLSFHESPSWPGTGHPSETGVGAGAGTTLNHTVTPGTGRSQYLEEFGTVLCGVADEFSPDFVLISAGFDALAEDPLGHQCLEPEDFGSMTDAVLGVAWEHCEGRVVAVLEGGYHPARTARAAVETIRALSRPWTRGSGT